MSIESEITRLQNAKTSLKASINAKTNEQNQITNETIDNYSAFVNSISSTTLLWENSSPNQAFSDQNVSIATLPNYDYVEIFAKNYALPQFKYMFHVKVLNGYDGYINGQDEEGSLVNRLFTIDWTQGVISFGKGRYKKYNSSSIAAEDNNRLVPVAIYGGNF